LNDFWQSLDNYDNDMLATFLKNEYPQTVALIISKMSPSKRGMIIPLLPSNFAMEVVMRMARMEEVNVNIILKVENVLKEELQLKPVDNITILKEMFENMNPFKKQEFIESIIERNRELALMISKEYVIITDIKFLDDEKIDTLINKCDKDILLAALLTAPQNVKDLFANKSEDFRFLKNLDIERSQKKVVEIFNEIV